MPFLETKNLNVEIDGKKILKNINLKLELGRVNALMGPNGSGKSTLAHALMGDPKYKITGKMILDGKDITKLSPDERARRGLFLSFQNPAEVSGVKISSFLRQAYNSSGKKKISVFEFQKLLEKEAEKLKIDKKFLSRYLNEGFSGGEKKKMEVLQLLVLNPKLAILDETDSGLDIDALKIVAEGIKNFMNKDKCILIITHYKRILDYVKPGKVFIMQDGKIVLQGSGDIVDKLEEKGYSGLWKEK